ncbi:Lytic transglycosylase catalytic (plasmid) [Oceanithermus profundus DSM 14977]|uniref:Lytic transglycosylase catalytic n=1 Tax=Oceanithermus profundus (strain DSM 14977 / NBRC 100410 / VKM B-2274 / 506) TaxID=670487 RepID=E4UAK8_OCEP5|nr:lytic transglycosylase domain-containing protein [Oceanithermus profundus]ADR37787.1 Lytic transglycosylase catalytic [Oceanithermus profundus DSM 14977]
MRTLVVALAVLAGSSLACGYIPAELYRLTAEAAARHDLPPDMLAALVWVESRYCPNARGKDGEIGLGQVLPSTARDLGVDPQKLWDPRLNLETAARYLAIQYRRFGRWELALAAYNAGPGRAYEPPRSTRQYVVNVLYVYEHLKKRRMVATK